MIVEEREPEQELENATPLEEGVIEEFNEAHEVLRPFAAVPLKISIELGKNRLKLSELLELGHHSVVGLDKPVGNNLDVFINGVLLARGEVVVIEDKVGVKINELADHDG